ncbi:hypothetical protein [Limibacillus halophilus]|jgi:hypothetical protein
MPLDPHARDALKFLLGHLAIGCAAAVLLTGLLIGFNLFHLRELIFEQENGWLAALLLLFGMVVTFGSLAMGVGVNGLKDRKGRDDS